MYVHVITSLTLLPINKGNGIFTNVIFYKERRQYALSAASLLNCKLQYTYVG